jgi:hypothetical protein
MIGTEKECDQIDVISKGRETEAVSKINGNDVRMTPNRSVLPVVTTTIRKSSPSELNT